MRRKRTLALAMLAGAATVLATTGPAAAHRNDRHGDGTHAVFVQTNKADGNTVRVFRQASNGTLSPAGEFPTGGLGGATVDAPGDSLASQGSLILSDHLLFAVNAGSDTVTVFRVNGVRLHRLQVIPSGGHFPVSIAVHDGLAFVLNGGGQGAIQGYRITHGRLQPIPGSNRSLGLSNTNPPNFLTSPGQVGVSPNGQWAFVTTKGNNTIEAFRIRHDGVLSNEAVVTTSATPVPFAFTFHRPNSLIVAEAGGSFVTTYRRISHGSLIPVGEPVSDGQAALCWIQQVGGFHFVTNTGSGTVSAYRIEPNGQPTLVAAVAAQTGGAPIDMAESRGFLYVQNAIGGYVQGYAVHHDGSLTLVTTVTDGLPVFADGIGMEGIAAS